VADGTKASGYVKVEDLRKWPAAPDLLAEVKQPPFVDAVDALFMELSDILLAKHADYGPRNVSGAPGGAMNGLRVRMHDKLARLNNLVDKAGEPNFESLEDTLVDLSIYAAIGVLVLRKEWPE
jgi:hypothetical protein